MRKWFPIILAALLLTACGRNKENDRQAVYRNISAEEAKQIMDSGATCVILDVRTFEEYESGHIPGAVCFPLDDIESKAKVFIPEQDVLYLIYCRSGRRSKQAAEILVELGYTNILEFGGIMDWPFEVE